MRNNTLFYIANLIISSVLMGIAYGDVTVVYLDEHIYELNHSIKLRTTSSEDHSWLILKASRSSYPNHGVFKYTVIPPDKSFFNDYRIQAKIEKFDMDRKKDCPDQLMINKTSGFVYNIFKGCDKPRDFKIDQLFQENSIIFQFNRTTVKKAEFEIILTVARNCHGFENDDEFKCSDFYCINEDLTCNKLQNCGDGSDERPILCHRRMVVGFSVAGVILFFIILSACLFCACRRRARRNTLGTERVLITPVNNFNSRAGLYPVQSVTPATSPSYHTIPATNPGYQGGAAANPYPNPYQQATTGTLPYQLSPPDDELPPPYAPPYPTGPNNFPIFPQAPPPEYPTK